MDFLYPERAVRVAEVQAFLIFLNYLSHQDGAFDESDNIGAGGEVKG
jgi:hypothetical protein